MTCYISLYGISWEKWRRGVEADVHMHRGSLLKVSMRAMKGEGFCLFCERTKWTTLRALAFVNPYMPLGS